MIKFIKHIGFAADSDLEKRLVFDVAANAPEAAPNQSKEKEAAKDGQELQKEFEEAKKEYKKAKDDYIKECKDYAAGKNLPIGKGKSLGEDPSDELKQKFIAAAKEALSLLEQMPDVEFLSVSQEQIDYIKKSQDELTKILNAYVPITEAGYTDKEQEHAKYWAAKETQGTEPANGGSVPPGPDKKIAPPAKVAPDSEKSVPEQQPPELTVLKDVYENLLKKTGVEKGGKDKYLSVKAYLAKLEEDLEKSALKGQLQVLKEAIINAIERSTQITNSLDKRVPSPQEVIVTIELVVQQKKRTSASEKTEAEIIEAAHTLGLKKPIEAARKKLQASGTGANNERIFKDIYEYLQSVEEKEYDKPEDMEAPAKSLEHIDYWIARDLMNEKLRLVVQEKVDGLVRDGVDPRTRLDSINSTIADTMGIYNNNPSGKLEPAIITNIVKPIVLATFLDPNNATLYKIERASTGGLQVIKAEPEATKKAPNASAAETKIDAPATAPEIVPVPEESLAVDRERAPIGKIAAIQNTEAKTDIPAYENEKSDQEIALEDRDGSLLKERGVQPKYLEILTKIDDYWNENLNAATSYEFKPFDSDIVKCNVSFVKDMFVLKYAIKGQSPVAAEFGTKQQLLRKINSGELYQELMKKVLSNEDTLKSLEPKIGKISGYDMYEDRMDADCTFKLDSNNNPEVKLKSLPDGRIEYTVSTEPSAFKGKAENLDDLGVQLAHIREWDNKKEEDKVSNKSLREEKLFSDIADKDNFTKHEKEIGRVEKYELMHDKGVNLNLSWGKERTVNATVLIQDGAYICALNKSDTPNKTCANFDQVIKALQDFRINT